MPEASAPQRSGRSSSSATPPPSSGERERDQRDGDGRGLPAPGSARSARRRAARASPRAARRAHTARGRARRVEQHHPVQRAEAGQADEREPARGRHRQRGIAGERARHALRAGGRGPAVAGTGDPRPERIPTGITRHASMAAAAPVRVVRKPWQPATSSTGRRFGSAPGITRMQPPGVRPSPRGGRSIGRAATSTTRPRRFWAATSDGPVDSSSSASRTCAAGQASRSFSITCARRSPGSSSEQPLRRAKCTVSEAAARTAPSSASCEAGRARVEHHERPRVGLRDQLALHQPVAAGERRPVDARGGRAGPVLAQAVELGLGGGDQRRAGVGRRGVAAAGGGADGQHARQHEDLVGAVAGDHALGEPERVAQHERGRRQPAAPAAAEGDLDAHARGRPAGAEADRLGQQRLVDPAGRQRDPAGAWRGSGPRAAAPRARCGRRARA